MGLFLSLITFPVSGPVRGVVWVAEQVEAEAEREQQDEADIRERLADLEQRLAAGELTEDEFDDAADELFEPLLATSDLEEPPDA